MTYAKKRYAYCPILNALNSLLKTTSIPGLQLYMEVSHHQMIDLLNKDIGVRVVVHDPLQFPYVSEYGLNIRPGDSTAIQVEKYQVNRLGHPWGKCLKSGKHLPFNYSYEPYSQLGCRRYCQNFYIKQHCNCVKRSLLSPSFNRPTKRKLNLICNFSDPIQRRCADEVVELIENETIQCNCNQACSTTLLELKVYYRTLTLENITESPAYSWETLIANIGGNLGFFMGLTIMTFAEIVELICDIVFIMIKLK
ncbi:degenerin unc-8 [Trichonephila clavata]|uniref:Degenerin unc-8 n=1 Tax=Trichonephila clavata TaxID=2740835 RepID=A0A8X6GAX3_TRICU|nr:degenerin unc-8 [Trichonephila clavata]